MVNSHLFRLLRGMSLHGIGWLIRAESMCKHMYVVHERNAAHPLPDSLPWPVCLLLATHSRKHVFPNNSRWNLSSFRQGVRDMCSRLAWACCFRGSDNETAADSRPLYKRSVKPCQNQGVDPLINNFNRGVTRRCVDVFHSTQKAGENLCRLPAYVTYGFRWLSSSPFSVAVSDKDGVFAIMSTAELQSLYSDQLNGACYRQISPDSLESEARTAKTSIPKLAVRLGKMGYKPWAREICDNLTAVSAHTMCCRTKCTVKTHKVPCELRLLHDASQCCLKWLSAAVGRILLKVVSTFSMVISSSEEALNILRNLRFPKGATIVKIDVKQFYLSGAHDVLNDLVVSAIQDEQMKTWMSDALSLLLDQQFLSHETPGGDTSVYSCVLGAGMGFPHAGGVADVALHQLMDNPVHSAHPDLFHAYIRFRDDILIVARNEEAGLSLVQLLTKAASPTFRLEIERVGLSAPFLDMWVEVRGDRMWWCPYTKPTANHVPLGQTSWHHSRVHSSWPVAEMLRKHRLSMNRSQFCAERTKTLQRWCRFDLSDKVIKRCRSWEPCVRSVCATKFEEASRQAVVSDTFRPIRLILPFHPCAYRAMLEAKQAFLQWKDVFQNLGMRVVFQSCFSSGGTSLSDRLCTTTTRKSKPSRVLGPKNKRTGILSPFSLPIWLRSFASTAPSAPGSQMSKAPAPSRQNRMET